MTPGDAIVIGTFSRRMRLRLADGREVDARIRGKRLRPVCGDRVTAQEIPDEREWLVTAIGDRDNELTRPNMRGQIEVLAANIDLLVVVAASPPAPDWFVVDRGTPAQWRDALIALDGAHDRLVTAVRRSADADLDEQVPAMAWTNYVMLHGVVQHNLYHAGQIALLMRAASVASVSK